MRFLIALKAFFKAFSNPKKGELFLNEKCQEEPVEKKEGASSHIQLLSLLQQSGRLIDFLQEDLSGFNDAQVGGAVRQIQKECRKTLEEHVSIKPVRDEDEGLQVFVEKGYDPTLIKLVGNVSQEPPFHGILRHKGWLATKHHLPKKIGKASYVIQPAEIEIR